MTFPMSGLSAIDRFRRNCSFINFTNISNAIKAIDGVKNKPDYANLRIAHGKDRCANPPRSGPQGGSGGRRSGSGNNANSQPPSAVEPTEDVNMLKNVVENGMIKEETSEVADIPSGEVEASA